MTIEDRRSFLLLSSAAGAGLALNGCAGIDAGGKDEAAKTKEVLAVEDLMREHGVLRRALLAYHLSARRLRRAPSAVAPDALNRTAMLFRSFGADYHERQLEEAFIFPVLQKAGGGSAELVTILIEQHQRGREITDYILTATTSRRVVSGNIDGLARALDGFVVMYQEHMAREDTVIFPAWKAALTPKQYDEVSDRFEAIERQTFGEDGFADAVKEISAIEEILGVGDLDEFTAPPPPHPRRKRG